MGHELISWLEKQLSQAKERVENTDKKTKNINLAQDNGFNRKNNTNADQLNGEKKIRTYADVVNDEKGIDGKKDADLMKERVFKLTKLD